MVVVRVLLGSTDLVVKDSHELAKHERSAQSDLQSQEIQSHFDCSLTTLRNL
jgi:hypothetical protein